MKPLEGIRVVELTTFVAAPTAALLMADWGAEVIKVEGINGDPMRYVGTLRRMPYCSDDENPYWDGISANKKFIALNPRTPEGMEMLKKLIDTADVFITNNRPAALEKMGLSYEEVEKRNPRLVYGQVLGYGEKGPEKDTPGFDYTAYVARGGFLNNFTPEESKYPFFSYSAFGDNQVGMALASGIMAALLGRNVTGHGDRVTVSLYGTAIFVSKWALYEAEFGVKFPTSTKAPTSPTVNAYKAKDGVWMMMCISEFDRYYDKLVMLLDRPDLLGHPVHSVVNNMVAEGKVEGFTAIMIEQFAKKDSDEWLRLFQEADLPLAKGFTFDDILADEQAWANDYIREITYPTGHKAKVFPNPVQMDRAGPQPFERSKPLGYHDEYYAKELGYSDEQIAQMREKGAIR